MNKRITSLTAFALTLTALSSQSAFADIVSEIRTPNSQGIAVLNGIRENSEDSTGAGFESALEYDVMPWLTVRGRYSEGTFDKTFEQFKKEGELTKVVYKSPFKVSTFGLRFQHAISQDFNAGLQMEVVIPTCIRNQSLRATPDVGE